MECCLVEVGEVTFSERVVISDPCYGRDVWCMDDNVHVKEGVYRVFVVTSDEGKFGVRIAQLLLVHKCLPEDINTILKREWTELCSIGVDSGQAGVFDNSVYPEETLDTGEHDDPNSFYGECCALILDTPYYGALRSKKGFVTSSGFGDGSYYVDALYENDERVALRIDFNIVEMREVMDKLIQR